MNFKFLGQAKRQSRSLVLSFRLIATIFLSLSFSMPLVAKKKLTAKDSLQLKIDSIYTAFLSSKKLYDAENEKAYLKQKYDTAKLFNLTRTMFLQLEELDSFDIRKNVNKLKYRKKNSELLDGYRRNLYNGGNFFLRKGENKKAYPFYDTYILSASNHLFESYNYTKTDSLMPQVAFWAVVAAGLQQSPSDVLKHSSLAMQWTRQEQVMQLQAIAYTQLGKTKEYLNVLKDGFSQYPEYLFFFNHLIDYYSNTDRQDSALAICNEVLGNEKTYSASFSQTVMLVKSEILANQGKWEECIPVCEKLLNTDSILFKPYYHLGLCYVSMAEALTERKDKKQKKSFFLKAQNYLETYRQMQPKAQKEWAPLLYKVYYNLNMGKQFREMENLI